MDETKKCNHDFVGLLRCIKCGKEFQKNWLDALVESKLEAINDILINLESKIRTKTSGKTENEAMDFVMEALEEVKKDYIDDGVKIQDDMKN